MKKACFRTASFFVFFLLVFAADAHHDDAAIHLHASINACADTSTVFGLRELATDQYDSGVDIPDPPDRLSDYVSVFILPMNGAPAHFTRFREDWRNQDFDYTNSTKEWLFKIATDQSSGNMAFDFSFGTQLDSSIPLRLIVGNHQQNLRDEPHYTAPVSDCLNTTMKIVMGVSETGTVDLLTPDAGAEVQVGSNVNVSWSVASSVNVQQNRLEVKKTSDTQWTLVAETVENQAVWVVPEGWEGSVSVRVTMVDILGNTAVSALDVQVVSLVGLQIVSPTPGTAFQEGEDVPIEWEYQGATNDVRAARVSYTLDGENYSDVQSLPASSTQTTWTAPEQTFSSEMGVKVTADVENGVPKSDEVRTLTVRSSTLLNPGFEDWTVHGIESGPPDNWSCESAGEYGTDWLATGTAVADAIDGFTSVRIHVVNSGTYRLYQEMNGLSRGMNYCCRCTAIDSEPNAEAYLELSYFDSNAQLINTYQSNASVDAGDGQRLEVIQMAPENAEYLRVALCVEASTAVSIYADNVAIDIRQGVPEVTILTPAGGASHGYNGTDALHISWDYGTTSSFVQQASLEYSLDDSRNWVHLATFMGAGTLSYDWLGANVFSTTCRVRVVVTNSEENGDTGVSSAFCLYPASVSKEYAAGWHMTGLPLRPPVPTVSECFGDDFSGGACFLFMATDDGSYVETEALAGGIGYWLATDIRGTVDISGDAESGVVSRPLRQGWNLLSNPYPASISKDDIHFVHQSTTLSFSDAVTQHWIDPVLYTYDHATGQYTAPGSGAIGVMNGIWLAALEAVDVVFSPPPYTVTNPQGTPVPSELNEEEWTATVLACRTPERRDELTLGCVTNGTDAYDIGIDAPAPPSVPAFASECFYFINDLAEYDVQSRLKDDYRAVPETEAANDRWLIFVRSGVEGVVIDFADILENVSESKAVYCRQGGENHNLRDYSSILIAAEAEEILELVVCEESMVDRDDVGQIPDSFGITSLYPNPFNQEVTVRYAISKESADVYLTLFDIHGRLCLKKEFNDVKKGYHNYVIRIELASGVYFVSIENEHGERSIRKAILIK